jgi:hypothetical protein
MLGETQLNLLSRKAPLFYDGKAFWHPQKSGSIAHADVNPLAWLR